MKLVMKIESLKPFFQIAENDTYNRSQLISHPRGN